MNPGELTIDVPYGKLAAKVWGPEDGRRVLALHGWLDSAATYDSLIPHLDPHIRVVALDFSGHGDSSHCPPGSHYSYLTFILDVKRTLQALQWKDVTILGHSLGAVVGLTYAGLFPREVVRIVALDVVALSYYPLTRVSSSISNAVTQLLEIEAKLSNPPVYGESELLDRMEEANPGQLTEYSKKVLLKRGAKVVEGGMVLKRDLRAKVTRMAPFAVEVQKEIVKRYKGELLALKVVQGNHRNVTSDELEFRELYRKNCKFFHYVEVNGTHYVHLNNPERVAPHISAFLRDGALKQGKL
uniref:AB hydrolase-1 domain-containing protein n=1 Tax=Ornithodoros turicata TaxID=34597 RepID=A0A2R5LAW6_9ACAR